MTHDTGMDATARTTPGAGTPRLGKENAMKKELALLQDLIDALDDASAFYGGAAPKVTRPCFKHLLTRIAQTHRRIADDLAASMIACGSSAARGGRLLQSLRMLRTAWQARVSSDIELACAIRAEACEERVLRHSSHAMARVADVELRHRLAQHHREIERASLDLGYLGSLLQMQANPASPREREIAIAARAPRHAAFGGAEMQPARSMDRPDFRREHSQV